MLDVNRDRRDGSLVRMVTGRDFDQGGSPEYQPTNVSGNR